MAAGGVAIMEAFCAAYARRDLELAGSMLADDIVFALHVDRDIVPFGGVTIGKEQVRRRWAMIVALFDMPLYRLDSAVADGDEVRARIAYRFCHKATGEEIDGHMRIVALIRDGLIARGNEYHDRARVEAFFRLVAQSG